MINKRCNGLFERVRLAEAGVQPFRGSEMPWERLGINPNRIYFVLRPAEDMERALRSFNGAPLLRTHHTIAGDQRRLNEAVIGATGSRAIFRDGFVIGDVKIWDNQAIDDVESGRRRQLSVGFTNGRVEMVKGHDQADAIVHGAVVDHLCLCGRSKSGLALDAGGLGVGDDWHRLEEAIGFFDA